MKMLNFVHNVHSKSLLLFFFLANWVVMLFKGECVLYMVLILFWRL